MKGSQKPHEILNTFFFLLFIWRVVLALNKLKGFPQWVFELFSDRVRNVDCRQGENRKCKQSLESERFLFFLSKVELALVFITEKV